MSRGMGWWCRCVHGEAKNEAVATAVVTQAARYDSCHIDRYWGVSLLCYVPDLD